MDNPTDEQLMTAYQDGDLLAFESLYKRHSGRVWAYVSRRISRPEQARDVFQGVFMKLHHSRRRYDPAFPFLPWLFTICRTAVIDEYRGEAIRPIPNDPQDLEKLAQPETLGTPLSALEVPSLAGLPAQQRQAIELRYGEDLSFDEIAKRLGTSSANIRQAVSRGVRKLRALAGKESV